MRYIGPKNKIARRLATDLGMKTPGSKSHAVLLKKLNIKPGQHGSRYRRKESEHSRQLSEKQKLRHLFGITEKQLKKYFTISSKKKGNTAEYLGEILERRLDNAIYRLGFTPTRASARQLVSHGHISVNDKRINIPSYLLKNNDKIAFSIKKSIDIPYISEYRSANEVVVPAWLELKKDKGTITKSPDNSLISQQINLRLVIEFYSR